MAWKRATFEVQTTEGKVVVSGITRRGLGLHLVGPHADGVRGIWHLVHLRSGLAFLIINMPTAEDASEIAEIIFNYANWRKFETPSAIAAADPQWMHKILGIKHSLPGYDWMEMLDPAMNDPARASDSQMESILFLGRRGDPAGGTRRPMSVHRPGGSTNRASAARKPKRAGRIWAKSFGL